MSDTREQILLSSSSIDPDYLNLVDCSDVKVVTITNTYGRNNFQVSSTKGLFPDNEYMLSDGTNSEFVTIDYVTADNNAIRIHTVNPITQVYDVNRVKIYKISTSVVYAADSRISRYFTWYANIKWSTHQSNTAFTIEPVVNITTHDGFIFLENGAISKDGYFTLMPSS